MKLIITHNIAKQLIKELNRAGSREIGGLLMGEHLKESVFRISNISFQRSGGSYSCFIRNPKLHNKHLKKFFKYTNHDYQRFNYLGEWHSHPSFTVNPSSTDIKSMQEMILDKTIRINFLILMIVRIENIKELQLSATVFQQGIHPYSAEIVYDNNYIETKSFLNRLFSFN